MANKERAMKQSGFVHILAIIIVVAIVIVAALFLAFVAPNDLSQNGSSNTNGNNNLNQSNENITVLPGQVTAQVIVTVHSTHTLFGVSYRLFLDAELKAQGDIPAHSSLIRTITLVFPENQTGLFKAVILATSNGGGFGDKSDQAIISPQSGGTYPITLNI